LLDKQKLRYHNMAGGFDGMGVSLTAHQPTATQLKGRCDGS